MQPIVFIQAIRAPEAIFRVCIACIRSNNINGLRIVNFAVSTYLAPFESHFLLEISSIIAICLFISF
jgi:hypothetical protein